MQKLRGFTLIELIVVVAIVAIMARLAVPGLVAIVRSNSMTSTVNSYLADLRFARSEAIRRSSTVIMCRSDSPEAATPACGTGSSSGWETGWIVFEDRDGNQDYTAAEPLVRVQSPITVVGSISDSLGSTKFQFTPTGQLKNNPNTTITFGSPTFAISAQRVVCVTVGGRGKIAGDGSATCP